MSFLMAVTEHQTGTTKGFLLAYRLRGNRPTGQEVMVEFIEVGGSMWLGQHQMLVPGAERAQARSRVKLAIFPTPPTSSTS